MISTPKRSSQRSYRAGARGLASRDAQAQRTERLGQIRVCEQRGKQCRHAKEHRRFFVLEQCEHGLRGRALRVEHGLRAEKQREGQGVAEAEREEQLWRGEDPIARTDLEYIAPDCLRRHGQVNVTMDDTLGLARGARGVEPERGVRSPGLCGRRIGLPGLDSVDLPPIDAPERYAARVQLGLARGFRQRRVQHNGTHFGVACDEGQVLRRQERRDRDRDEPAADSPEKRRVERGRVANREQHSIPRQQPGRFEFPLHREGSRDQLVAATVASLAAQNRSRAIARSSFQQRRARVVRCFLGRDQRTHQRRFYPSPGHLAPGAVRRGRATIPAALPFAEGDRLG